MRGGGVQETMKESTRNDEGCIDCGEKRISG
jgi:hypothetical protein